MAPLLLSPRVFVEATLESAGLSEHIDEVDRRFRLLTGRPLADGNVSDWAPSVAMPTLTYGAYDDSITRVRTTPCGHSPSGGSTWTPRRKN